MSHIAGTDRTQVMITSLDLLVAADSDARIIDAFVDGLDLEGLGFGRAAGRPAAPSAASRADGGQAALFEVEAESGAAPRPTRDGRPSYDPRAMLKLYVYGNCNGLRSSRALAKACRVNVEAMWLVEGLTPDHRTVNRFRKENAGVLKDVFRAFGRAIRGPVAEVVGTKGSFESVDGSKFRASCSKMANFTAGKLDDRIAWLESRIREYEAYLDELDAADAADQCDGTDTRADGTDPDIDVADAAGLADGAEPAGDQGDGQCGEDGAEVAGDAADTAGEDGAKAEASAREVVEGKLAEATERLDRYNGYLRDLEESGETQLSLTDPDARLMKGKQGFVVAYNPQTVVNSATHLIDDYEMTNAPTDHGQLEKTLGEVAGETGGVLEATADKGYQSPDDIVACLDRGILPHVILADGAECLELEIGWEDPGEDPLDRESCDPAEIRRCLHAGVIPKAYEHAITLVEVAVAKRRVYDEEPAAAAAAYGSPEEMEARARQGYFVRDPGRNLVWCPNGEKLRQKGVGRSGDIRYANRVACRRCPFKDRCLGGKQSFKDIGFTKDQLEKPCAKWHAAVGTEPDSAGVAKAKYHYDKVRVVRLSLRPDIVKTSQRMGISEHPFGTIKRSLGADHFLLRGLENVDGEFAMMCLAYNIRRARNILGFDALLAAMVA